MMSSTILLLMLLGIFQQINCEESCEDLKKTEGATKCCEKDNPKKLNCAYLSEADLKASSACNCFPTRGAEGEVTQDCHWSTITPQLIVSNTVPCAAYHATCPQPVPPREPHISCNFGYPPPPEVMCPFQKQYCNFKKGQNFLVEEVVYDVYFTCWLYRCGNRLEKPKETTDKSDKLQWCYPPILRDAPTKLTYCPLYTDASDIYEAKPFTAPAACAAAGGAPVSNSTTGTMTKPSTQSGCVLAPICDHYGVVDRKKYMIPWYEGKADERHCEVLCDEKGRNDGKKKIDGNEVQCRRIPSCVNGTTKPDPKYNRYQVPLCRPWCSDEESLRKPNNESVCNPTPMCTMVDGKPQILAPYSLENPFGSERCLEKKDCSGEQKEETHHCTAVPEPVPEAKPSNKTGGLSFIMPMVIAVLCAFRV